MTATNRSNFVRLAENRTEKALKAIRVIGNLSNPTNYSYDDQDVREIFTALNWELRKARSRFQNGSGSNGAGRFQLSPK